MEKQTDRPPDIKYLMTMFGREDIIHFNKIKDKLRRKSDKRCQHLCSQANTLTRKFHREVISADFTKSPYPAAIRFGPAANRLIGMVWCGTARAPQFNELEADAQEILHQHLGAPETTNCTDEELAEYVFSIEEREHFAETTYLAYRDEIVPLMESPELAKHLGKRYGRELINLGGKTIPAAVIWKNTQDLKDPDELLGQIDRGEPQLLTGSSVFQSPEEYAKAREFIRNEYTQGPVKHESLNYRMTSINISNGRPKIDGLLSSYYDNILTQYSMEWELKKAMRSVQPGDVDRFLGEDAELPMRRAVEASGDPLISGHGRCAALTISTLVVYARRDDEFGCLIRRRSSTVGVSRGMLHIVPAGMCESNSRNEKWSFKRNIWRELLEEVYGEKELQGKDRAESLDYIYGIEPMPTLLKLFQEERAELSVTGIVCDLLNLRPEICTVLYVADPVFSEKRSMPMNWETQSEARTGNFAVNWSELDHFIANDVVRYKMVCSGAACLALGREWITKRHGNLRTNTASPIQSRAKSKKRRGSGTN